MFIRNLTYKFLFDPDRLRTKEERKFSESIKHFKMDEFRALRDLILLLEENDTMSHNNIPTSVPGPSPIPTNNQFKPKSRHFPDLSQNPQIWTFLQNVVSDIKHMDTPSRWKNLTSTQRQAISRIHNHPDVIVKPADKGGNIVLLTRSFYEAMCIRILSNKDWYKRILHLLLYPIRTNFWTSLEMPFWKDWSPRIFTNTWMFGLPGWRRSMHFPKCIRTPCRPLGDR